MPPTTNASTCPPAFKPTPFSILDKTPSPQPSSSLPLSANVRICCCLVAVAERCASPFLSLLRVAFAPSSIATAATPNSSGVTFRRCPLSLPPATRPPSPAAEGQNLISTRRCFFCCVALLRPSTPPLSLCFARHASGAAPPPRSPASFSLPLSLNAPTPNLILLHERRSHDFQSTALASSGGCCARTVFLVANPDVVCCGDVCGPTAAIFTCG